MFNLHLPYFQLMKIMLPVIYKLCWINLNLHTCIIVKEVLSAITISRFPVVSTIKFSLSAQTVP